jgi:hypothetical protein
MALFWMVAVNELFCANAPQGARQTINEILAKRETSHMVWLPLRIECASHRKSTPELFSGPDSMLTGFTPHVVRASKG